jgi:murein DD-endopeptidase MepM/ murein hydrolase activator NlpD
MNEPQWRRPQERRRRAKRRLAAVAGVVFAVAVAAVLILAWRARPRSLAAEPRLSVNSALDNNAQIAAPATAETVDSADAGLEDELAAMPVTEAEAPVTELWGPPEPFRRLRGILQPGDTLGTALDDAGVAPATVQQIVQALRGTLDVRRVRPQDKFDLVVNAEGALLAFQFERGLGEIYRIDPRPAKWVAVKEQRALERRLALIHGKVETTLFEAIEAAGEKDDLIMSFVEIFAWAIDFSVFTRRGDTFEMVVEKLYDQGVFRGYGRIFTAQYVNAGEPYDATYFEAPDGFAGYYDNQGRNLRRAFLKAPLRFNLITSSFTYSRFHPILKVNRPHLGVDYAAPVGTPIWSVADGVVTGAGWMGGSGRAVKIRHRNGIESSYSHLIRIAAGMRTGVRVRQKQIIGYLGSTGLSTGPHLHYGMKVNGRAVNPAKFKLPAGDPVPKKYLAEFALERDKWAAATAAMHPQAGAKVVPAAAKN